MAKEYISANLYGKRCFGSKVYKLAMSAATTCPNRDGTVGTGGCIFCSAGGSGDFAAPHICSVEEQIQQAKALLGSKGEGLRYIAYFQSYTGTYGDLERLERIYTEAAEHPEIAGLSIATRPDCVGEDVLTLLSEVAAQKPLTVELGLQSSSDETAERIHRGYPFAVFENTFLRLKRAGIRVCVHIIDGLPGETQVQMLGTARTLAWLRPDAMKIHLLHIIRGTQLAALFESGRYEPMDFEQYIDTVIRQLELLPPETVIERITGDGDKTKLLAPLWSRDKIRVLGTIDHEMAARNTWQGRLYSPDDLHLS